MAQALTLDIAEAFGFLFQPARYKVAYGGRGGGKSWSIARALLAQAYAKPLRILCAREFQSSIADSVHKLLSDQIDATGLAPWFEVQKTTIIAKTTGSQFIFKGLHRNIQGIRSTEGADICWVEEAQTVSEESWRILIPTIRTAGSEIWISFNPMQETDPTYQRFVVHPPPDALVRKVGWEANPWFSDTLDRERRYMLATDPDAYEHVWGGACQQISEATVLRGKVIVQSFATPDDADFYFGVDWGFAESPTVMVRCYMADDCLYIDHEAYSVGCELDHTDALFDCVPGARDWPIKADSARPETISFMRRRGFNIAAAEKWPGSVEDGIAHLKAFRKIIVHERCPRTAQEARLYSYKIDAKTGQVLPKIVDAHNHCWDAVRYALDGFIQARGGLGIWARLAS